MAAFPHSGMYSRCGAFLYVLFVNIFRLLLHILVHHKSQPQQHGVLKISDIQSQQFLQLVQPVNQSISVNIEMSGRFCNV